jgi:hypothetical protein
LSGDFESFAREIRGGMIPPSEPRIVAHFLREPVIGDVIHGRGAAMAQTEQERFGKSEQAEDMNDLGSEGRDALAQRHVVLRFEFLQLIVARHEFVIVNAVEQQAAFHFTAALRHLHAVRGGEHAHLVPAQLEIIHRRFATKVERAGVVRRIEVCNDEDFHRGRG